MNESLMWRLAVCLVIWFAVTRTSPAAETETDPPNVVFILADDLGWRDLG